MFLSHCTRQRLMYATPSNVETVSPKLENGINIGACKRRYPAGCVDGRTRRQERRKMHKSIPTCASRKVTISLHRSTVSLSNDLCTQSGQEAAVGVALFVWVWWVIKNRKYASSSPFDGRTGGGLQLVRPDSNCTILISDSHYTDI
jgi:hypothetical protein